MTVLFPLLAYAVLWMAIGGSFTILNLALGLVLSAVALWLVRSQIGLPRRLGNVFRVAALAGFFAKELILSALRVARIVLTPDMRLQPGVFAFPLRLKGDAEIALLANMITLTPGTLSVDVSPDRRTLFVHAIDCRDPDAARRDIADGFERCILEGFG